MYCKMRKLFIYFFNINWLTTLTNKKQSILILGESMPEIKVHSDVTGTAWKIVVSEGQAVDEGDELMIAEAMKMEIPHLAPEAGVVKEICVKEGATISEDDLLFIIET